MVMMFVCQAWERLEKAEHERELALRTELIRQEKLEQLARRFDRKAAMRETWLSENQRLVSQVGRCTISSSYQVLFYMSICLTAVRAVLSITCVPPIERISAQKEEFTFNIVLIFLLVS